jgi:hypothetical protein
VIKLERLVLGEVTERPAAPVDMSRLTLEELEQLTALTDKINAPPEPSEPH